MGKALTIQDRKDIVEIEKIEFEMSQRVAKAFISSQMIPAHLREVGSMMVINQMSKDLGLPALGIAQNIYMIKGRVGMSGELIISLLNNSGIFDKRMNWNVENEGTEDWRVQARNTIDGEEFLGEWMDAEFVKKQGWLSNSKWLEMPIQMAKYRTAKRFASLYASEVVMGISQSEDLEDAFDVTAENVVAMPTEEEVADINKLMVGGTVEVDSVEAEVEETLEITEPEVETPTDEQVEVAEPIEDIPEHEHEPVTEPPKVMRASKFVASHYDQMEAVGFRRGHLSTVVKYYQLNDDNIKDFIADLEQFRIEFYAHHTNITPNPEIAVTGSPTVAKEEPKEEVATDTPKDTKMMSEAEYAEHKASQEVDTETPFDTDTKEEVIEPPVEEQYKVHSDVAVEYSTFMMNGLKRKDLVKFVKAFRITDKDIEKVLANLKAYIAKFYETFPEPA